MTAWLPAIRLPKSPRLRKSSASSSKDRPIPPRIIGKLSKHLNADSAPHCGPGQLLMGGICWEGDTLGGAKSQAEFMSWGRFSTGLEERPVGNRPHQGKKEGEDLSVLPVLQGKRASVSRIPCDRTRLWTPGFSWSGRAELLLSNAGRSRNLDRNRAGLAGADRDALDSAHGLAVANDFSLEGVVVDLAAFQGRGHKGPAGGGRGRLGVVDGQGGVSRQGHLQQRLSGLRVVLLGSGRGNRFGSRSSRNNVHTTAATAAAAMASTAATAAAAVATTAATVATVAAVATTAAAVATVATTAATVATATAVVMEGGDFSAAGQRHHENETVHFENLLQDKR